MESKRHALKNACFFYDKIITNMYYFYSDLKNREIKKG